MNKTSFRVLFAIGTIIALAIFAPIIVMAAQATLQRCNHASSPTSMS